MQLTKKEIKELPVGFHPVPRTGMNHHTKFRLGHGTQGRLQVVKTKEKQKDIVVRYPASHNNGFAKERVITITEPSKIVNVIFQEHDPANREWAKSFTHVELGEGSKPKKKDQ